MWRSVIIWVVLGFVLFSPPSSDAVQPAAPLVSKKVLLPYISKAPPPTFQQQVITLVNQERGKVGCGPVMAHAALNTAAQSHAQAMASQNFFAHTNPFTGSTPSSRAMAAGYPTGAAENIAAGQSTPQSVMNAWMSSSGHRANILNCSYRSIGVGYVYDAGDTFGPYYHYWVQNFGTQ